MKTLVCLTLALAVSGVSFGQKIAVKIENTPVKFDAEPMDRNKVAMVPLRSMLDAIGATMRWDLEKQTITFWHKGTRADFVVGNRQAMVNGKRVDLDEAPFVASNRIYAPLKFIATSCGYVISLEKGWYVLRGK